MLERVSQIGSRLTGFIPGVSGPSNDIIAEVKELIGMYSARKTAFDSWYRLLSLEDELYQQDMESFVGNDPRTTWNMATFLLQPKPFVHTVVKTDGTVLPDSTREVVQFVQQNFSRLWAKIDRSDMKRGRNSWFWNFIGMTVATGWYAVPHIMTPDGQAIVDYWNPATVYPEFSDNPDEGILRLARVRILSANQANINVQREGWINTRKFTGTPVESQLWKLLAPGVVAHGVAIDNQVVKPLTIVESEQAIPILTGHTGGIPLFSSDARKHNSGALGQGILATNESLYRNYNKQQTFLQQLLRDTANPRIKVTQVGNNEILPNAQDWYKRGAAFKVGINEDIGVIPQAGIPVELTQTLFGIRNQLQRGGFSDLTFGNILSEVSAVLVTLSAEAAMQLISPFQSVVQFVVSEVTNDWYQQMLRHPNLRATKWPDHDPADLVDTRIMSTYAIKIPGDLSNRINMAKALNPRLELPVEQVIELFLPEVRNIVESVSKLEGEKARQHPSYQQVMLVQAFEQAGHRAGQDNPELASMFRAVANNLRSQLTGEATPETRLGQNGQRSEAEGILPDNSAVALGTNVGGPNGSRG